MIHFIVQARSGSTRLPNKILLPFFKEQSILDLLIEKLKRINDTGVIVATSINANCDPIQDVACNHAVKCFRGDENDVLQRFIDSAEKHGVNEIIRVCSDNPFLELDSIYKLISFVKESEENLDYVSYLIDGTPSIKTHYGFWTEYVTLDALRRVSKYTSESLYHEHVTNYIYTHPEKFKIGWIKGPDIITKHRDIRLTIDTYDDFENAKSIYSELCINNPYPSIDDVVLYLDNHKQFYSMMRTQIDKNIK